MHYYEARISFSSRHGREEKEGGNCPSMQSRPRPGPTGPNYMHRLLPSRLFRERSTIRRGMRMRKWRGVYGHALARIDVHVVQTRANRAWGRGGRKGTEAPPRRVNESFSRHRWTAVIGSLNYNYSPIFLRNSVSHDRSNGGINIFDDVLAESLSFSQSLQTWRKARESTR